MKWLLLGALLAVLLLYPPALAIVVAIAVAVLSKPVVIAFGLGLAVRTHAPRMPRWLR